MEININDLKVNVHYKLIYTSFVYVTNKKNLIEMKTNSFGSPKISYISSDYIICTTYSKFCYIIVNPGEINDEY